MMNKNCNYSLFTKVLVYRLIIYTNNSQKFLDLAVISSCLK